MQTREIENPDESYLDCDVLLVGAGIMSATLALLLKELNSNYRIEIVVSVAKPRRFAIGR